MKKPIIYKCPKCNRQEAAGVMADAMACKGCDGKMKPVKVMNKDAGK